MYPRERTGFAVALLMLACGANNGSGDAAGGGQKTGGTTGGSADPGAIAGGTDGGSEANGGTSAAGAGLAQDANGTGQGGDTGTGGTAHAGSAAAETGATGGTGGSAGGEVPVPATCDIGGVASSCDYRSLGADSACIDFADGAFPSAGCSKGIGQSTTPCDLTGMVGSCVYGAAKPGMRTNYPTWGGQAVCTQDGGTWCALGNAGAGGNGGSGGSGTAGTETGGTASYEPSCDPEIAPQCADRQGTEQSGCCLIRSMAADECPDEPYAISDEGVGAYYCYAMNYLTDCLESLRGDETPCGCLTTAVATANLSSGLCVLN